MDHIAERLTEKIQTLSAQQLADVERFVESLQAWERDRAETREWATLSSRTFANVWNNPDDDIYDAL